MSKLKKILVLTADAGFGHRSAALAVQAALEEKYGDACRVEIVNPLEDKRAPFFLRDSQSDYDRIVRNAPELYRLGYDVTDASIPNVLMESTLTLLLFEVLRDLIIAKRPDVIVTTYPLYQAPLDAICKVYRANLPVFTVITDLVDVHRIWFSESVTGCMAPTFQVREQAIANGVPRENVHVTGIPVHPNVVGDKRPKAELRRELGWDERKPTLLVVGSRRVGSMAETLEVLNHFGKPLQLAVSAGNDEELYQELLAVEWHQKIHLYKFVDNMPAMMRAADAIVCKAGGLIVTESLACGLPMLLIDILPGQEMGNADYVIRGGAGDLVTTQMETLVTLSHWFDRGGRLLKERARAAAALGKPKSAHQVADIIWSNSTIRALNKKRRVVDRPLLLQFLTKNKIDFSRALSNRKKRVQE